jgi:uncharacterized membrane protein YphA (DoxX/SURF4 family)
MPSMTRVERAAAIFLTRAMIGFVYLFAGVHKLAEPGLLAFARAAAAQPDAAPLVPAALLLAIGALTPLVEIALGTLLLVGLWTRPALRAAALLLALIVVAYGMHGLLHPIGATAMDVQVVNRYILPRAALVIVTLLLPAEDDLLSLDAWREARVRAVS